MANNGRERRVAREEHGGELHMLDEREGEEHCWRSVAPRANRLLWFRGKVLHKVCAAHRPRLALTHFWFDENAADKAEKKKAEEMKKAAEAKGLDLMREFVD